MVLLSTEDATPGGQLAGIGAIFAFVFGASFILWFALKITIGIRVSQEQEYEGVDMAECGMQAYPEFVSGFVPSTGTGEGTPRPAQPKAAKDGAAGDMRRA